jgi:hypothetical protein
MPHISEPCGAATHKLRKQTVMPKKKKEYWEILHEEYWPLSEIEKELL